MKNTLTLLALTLLSTALYAQQAPANGAFEIKAVNPANQLPSFIRFQATNLPGQNIDQWFQKNLDANADFHLQPTDSAKDPAGNSHIRFRQYYHGIPVEESMVNLHHKNTTPQALNGTFYPRLTAALGAKITEQTALALALKRFAATDLFIWQDPAWAQIYPPEDKRNEPPHAEMVILSKTGTGAPEDFRLAYKFDIFSVRPLADSLIFVDAIDGTILHTRSMICESDKIGTAHTKYSGIQTITCDSIAPNHYELNDRSRANFGIITYNDASSTLVPFVDDDNDWNNVNASQDEIATDIHWGLEMSYDFYKAQFGRNSIDNRGRRIIGSAHYGGSSYASAWSLGGVSYFGDGNGGTIGPFTTIDIVGHEYTHGLTDATAALQNMNESGALNESFSDIFGKCIEHYAKPASFTWGLGTAVCYACTKPWRDLKNPNATGQPKYYEGLLYDYSIGTGGTHTNNAIQTLWFYLLCEGGSGTREYDLAPYTVDAIGWEKAMAITYTNLTSYLVPTSKYPDAALSAIEVAKLLYGASSSEAYNVQMAWYAVGLADKPEKSTAIPSVTLTGNSSIHPNPTKDIVYITTNTPLENASLRLTNLAGQTLQFRENINGTSATLDTKALPEGIYILELFDHSGLSRHKIVKY